MVVNTSRKERRAGQKCSKGDFCWRLPEFGHIADLHIKEERIRRDGGERSPAAGIALLHTCTDQANTRLKHHSCRFRESGQLVVHLSLSHSQQQDPADLRRAEEWDGHRQSRTLDSKAGKSKVLESDPSTVVPIKGLQNKSPAYWLQTGRIDYPNRCKSTFC